MLKRLEIDNFILIDKVRLDFDGSFCCITGESGSGKSMILKALNSLRTGKIEPDWRFDSERDVRLSAVISIRNDVATPELISLFEDNSIELESGEIIFERVFGSGRMSSFVQGYRKPAAVFNKMLSLLIAQNFQRDEARILEKGYALQYLDSFSGTVLECENLKRLRSDYVSLLRKMEMERRALEKSLDDKEYLEHAVSEISAAGIVPNEDEQIRAKLKSLRDRESVLAGAKHAHDVFSHGPASVVNSIRIVSLDYESIMRKDESVSRICDRICNLSAEAEEVAEIIRKHYEELQSDDSSPESLVNRQDALSRLKRKYGGTLESVLAFKSEAQNKLEMISDSDAKLRKVEREAELLEADILAKQDSLDSKRDAKRIEAEKTVDGILGRLSMKDARFEIRLEKSRDAQSGSSAEFFICVNKGKGSVPLNEVVSGGEMSRIFLAMLCAVGGSGSECEIFDEIDAGLGGQSASNLAQYLKDLSANNQIIAVTHQAIVAAKADCNVRVWKKMKGGRTVVEAEVMSADQKKKELQRMIAGDVALSQSAGMEELLRVLGQ